MLQISRSAGGRPGDVDRAELRLATKIGVEEDVHDSVLRIDLEFGSDLGLKIAFLLKEANQRLAIVFDFGGVVRRLG